MSSPSSSDGRDGGTARGSKGKGPANQAAIRGGGTVHGQRERRQGIQRQPRLPKRGSK